MFSLRKWMVLSALGVIWAPLSGWPQSVGTKAAAVAAASSDKERYAAEALVVEHLDTEYHYAADGTGTKQVTMTVLLQSDAAVKQFGVVTIGFAGNSEHAVFDYVRVRKPDGSVVETPLTDAQEMPQPVTQQAPFYSDLKEVQIPVRNLAVGDQLEYRSREIMTKAEAPNQFWDQHRLMEGVVVLSETVELRFPKSKAVTVWSPSIKPTITEDGDDRVYQWTHTAIDPTVGKEAEAKKEADKKRVLTEAEQLDRTEGKFPQIAWTTFKSWAEVGEWYRSLAAPRAVPDDDVKAKVAQLIAGKTTEEDKIRALYAYVSTQIRYIGVAFGIGRYQPHMAGDVLSNQYGDCKDKHTLLAAMLSAAGIPSDAVLIGANIRFNKDVPSPGAFNHLITAVSLNGKLIWLDSTEEVAPYRVLWSPLRDKDTLVIPPTGAPEIEKTPADLPFQMAESFDAKGSIDANGHVTSHMVMTLRGDGELVMRAALRLISPGQYGDFVQRFSQGLGYGGTTSNVEISKPDATADPLRITYDYTRDKPDDWANYKITPEFLPVYLPVIDDKDPPQTPIELGTKRVEMVTAAMKLPDGWSATLPDAVHVHTPFATFDKTYRFDHGTLYADRKIEVLEQKVPAADWKQYKKFTDDVGLSKGETYVQLTSAVKKAGEAGPPAPSVSNKDAAQLIQQAAQTSQTWDLAGTTKLLDQAKKLNDKQPYLWSMYGYVAVLRGTNLEAASDFKKELALHPDEQQVYAMLAKAQIATGSRSDAVQTLRSGLKLGPNIEMALMVAPLLYEDGAYAEETKILLPVAAKQPDNERLQLALGNAEMKSGNTEDGSKTLAALLKSTEDSAILNDAAYTLADGNMELALAETSTLKALDQMTKESATLTLDANSAMARAKAQWLAATWDTMGWVYFREHKLDDAEDYLHAAWLSDAKPSVGLHLGQLEEAQGKLNEALKTYDLALAASGSGSVAYSFAISKHRQLVLPASTLGSTAGGTVTQELHRRADALKRKGARDRFSGTASTALQNLRRLRIGPAEGRSGTADYKVLMTGGHVEAVKGPDDNAVRNADAMVHQLIAAGWWPKGSLAKMVREGILNCHSGVCEFVMVPLQ